MSILKMQQRNTIQPLYQILDTLNKCGIERDFLNWNEYLSATDSQHHTESEMPLFHRGQLMDC